MKPLAEIRSKLQRGFSLITAIFLLVVLAGLGAVMVTFFTTQQQSSTLDVMGSRVYQASRAGLEWAAYNIEQVPRGTLWAGCATIPTPLFAAGILAGTLSPFAVTVTCTPYGPYTDGSTIYVYSLTSTASYGGAPGQPDYVERVISVNISR